MFKLTPASPFSLSAVAAIGLAFGLLASGGFLLSEAQAANARQSHQSQSIESQNIEGAITPQKLHRYTFQDIRGKQQSLSFPLTDAAVSGGLSIMRGYDPNRLARTIRQHVTGYINDNYTGLVDVVVSARDDGYDLSYSGDSLLPWDIIQEAISQQAARAEKDYYRESYLYALNAEPLRPAGSKGNMLAPDYSRIAYEFTPAVAEAARAIAQKTEGKSLRDSLSFTLAFLQSIPYRELNTRDSRQGYGLFSPANVINSNSGDCDSKAVTFASILGTLAPDIPVVMVLVPGHALVGLGIPAEADDRVLNHGGIPYVLAEPVGPGLPPLGQIADTSAAFIKTGEVAVLNLTAAQYFEYTAPPLPPRPGKMLSTSAQPTTLEGAPARQLSFSFSDAAGRPQSLNFSLPESALNTPESVYDPALQRDELNAFLRQRLELFASRHPEIERVEFPDKTAWRFVKADNISDDAALWQSITADANALTGNLLQDWLETKGFRRTDDNFIDWDYGRLAVALGHTLTPLAEALVNKTPDAREGAKVLAAFMAALPYKTRITRNKDGRLIEPGAMALFGAQGADSFLKATAMAGVYKRAYPDIEVAVARYKNGAHVALGLPVTSGDMALKDGAGITYLTVDPAGPGYIPLGSIRPYFRDAPGKGDAPTLWTVPSS